jgi:predicted ATPase/class 3 adenylate cyclase
MPVLKNAARTTPAAAAGRRSSRNVISHPSAKVARLSSSREDPRSEGAETERRPTFHRHRALRAPNSYPSASGASVVGSDASRRDDGLVQSLPSGTVTFLFTDIEGSTQLLRELGAEEYERALAGHREVLRAAVKAHRGSEVDTQGDAFFVAFSRAGDAIAAAADAQRGLASATVRVRMGIHTGEPLRTTEGYAGMDVHRAARIAAAGHGGQVLVSETARLLVDEDLSADFALRDLGAHRLKDLTAPQRIFQLEREGLQREFPPLRTLEHRATNLPPQPTGLVGRERELAELVELLRRPDVRFVTTTGPGGAGKTRLALQVAADLIDDFADGAFLVSLAATTEPDRVLPKIADVLRVREAGGRSSAEILEEYLRERELLLVLDNFEHLLDAAAAVAGLVLGAAGVKVICSSRSALRVSLEHEYRVPELAESDAIALFVERAQAVENEFRADGAESLIAEICRRLDGLPLALELAAARSNVLSPRALLGRLERRLPVLTGGARDLPDRQRTLRDTIAWSYELLDETDQRLFARLAVFAGGFTADAAEQVCGADLETLASLVEKSLLRQSHDRFRMLETIREYALEQFGDERDEVLARHTEFFLDLVERAHGDGPREWASVWLDRLDLEHDNLRAALVRVSDLGDRAAALRLAAALGEYWHDRGHFEEGASHLQTALTEALVEPPSVRGEALTWATMIAIKRGDVDAAREFAESMKTLSEASADEGRYATALNMLGYLALDDEQFDDARALFGECKAIAERLGDDRKVQTSMHGFGLVSMVEGEYARAVAELDAALTLSRELDIDERQIGNGLCDLGYALLGAGRLGDARARLAESLELCARLEWRENVAYDLIGLCAVSLEAKQCEHAARLFGQVERLRGELQLTLQPYAERVRGAVERDAGALLGEQRFEALQVEGAALSLQDAVAVALSHTNSSTN